MTAIDQVVEAVVEQELADEQFPPLDQDAHVDERRAARIPSGEDREERCRPVGTGGLAAAQEGSGSSGFVIRVAHSRRPAGIDAAHFRVPDLDIRSLDGLTALSLDDAQAYPRRKAGHAFGDIDADRHGVDVGGTQRLVRRDDALQAGADARRRQVRRDARRPAGA
jgi:hypothetical protein